MSASKKRAWFDKADVAEVVKAHCLLSGRIRRLLAIREFLIKEVDKKKKGVKTFPVAEWRQLYRKVLYMNRRQFSMFDSFPCSFKGQLENAMVKCLPPGRTSDELVGFNLVFVYYTDNLIPEPFHTAKFATATFVVDEWALENTTSVTPADKAILRSFATEMIEFMNHACSAVLQTGIKDHRLFRERQRFEKCCHDALLFVD